MCGVDDQMQHLVKRRVDVQHVHAWRSHHHVTRRHVGDANHAFKHDPRFGVDDLVVLGLGEGLDQLVFRVRARVDEFREPLQESTLVFMPQAALRPRTGWVVGHWASEVVETAAKDTACG